MSKIYLAEKTQLDSAKTSFAVCSTAAATAAKTVTASDFILRTGTMISVKFAYANTAVNPTLNVNGTGAKSIYYHNLAVPTGMFMAGGVYLFVYDGARWELMGNHFEPAVGNTPGCLISNGGSGTMIGDSNSASSSKRETVFETEVNFSVLAAKGYGFILFSYIEGWVDYKQATAGIRVYIKNTDGVSLAFRDISIHYFEQYPGSINANTTIPIACSLTFPISNIKGTGKLQVEANASNFYTKDRVCCYIGPIYAIS